MWFKKNKWKIIISLLAVAILAAAFIFGGVLPSDKDAAPAPSAEASPAESPDASLPAGSPSPEPPSEESLSPSPDESLSPSPEESAVPSAEPSVSPSPSETPKPVEPEDALVGAQTRTCTIFISCATILNNMDLCDPDKAGLVPSDGWILGPVEVSFNEGESVFDVLQQVCRDNAIHMEFENTPMYNSAYIEGIANLYEFDVGELSGWMYSVNGWFPNYGCSRYQLADGDVISWVYTCDLGSDVGGGVS